MTKLGMLRVVTALAVSWVVLRGVIAGDFRYGGICTVGAGDVWFTCPLGFLERSLASGTLLPQWPSVILVVISVILLGRVFCAWGCPVVPVRRAFGENGGSGSRRATTPQPAALESYSSYLVLGGALLGSLLFKFPVFCYFCPIGLAFGALYAAIRFFSPEPLGWELVIFPAMLVLELWVLKSWCRSICPVGALLSIAGNLNRFLLPTVSKEHCLTSRDVNCQKCSRVCPEGIDLAKLGKAFSPNSCTKCLECYDKCPEKAIEIAPVR